MHPLLILFKILFILVISFIFLIQCLLRYKLPVIFFHLQMVSNDNIHLIIVISFSKNLAINCSIYIFILDITRLCWFRVDQCHSINSKYNEKIVHFYIERYLTFTFKNTLIYEDMPIRKT